MNGERVTAGGVVVRVIAMVVLGILLAALATFVVFVGRTAALNLVVWAIVGAAIGAASRRWGTAVWTAAVLGFSIVFGYSVLGYHATAPISGALVPFALIALIGAVGMAAAGVLGHALRRLVRRRAAR